ncbi:MAG: glycosyltransferase [Sediminibacterium sp.]|nr:glycosyltransferase [Sediminibacterium sp.]
MLVLHIIFIISALCIAHTYVFYPLFCIWRVRNHKRPVLERMTSVNLPEVAVVFAAYNEEAVIEAKLKSIYEGSYPLNKIHVYVGSDASTDRTEEIVKTISEHVPGITLQRFPGRMGKTRIVNELVQQVKQPVLIMTDANVIFKADAIEVLVNRLESTGAAIVGANIYKEAKKEEGIVVQEKAYMRLENRIKQAESDMWKLVIGVEGGCYAMRRALFTPVPDHFKVDDFYITFTALAAKQKVLFEEDAVCFEDVPVQQEVEFKRKARISTGNFQNLKQFRTLLWPPYRPLGFAFLSHKVLRWLTPFFILLCLLSSLALMVVSNLFLILFIGQLVFMMIPFLERRLKTGSRLMTYISHFYMMNLALLIGFFRFMNGVSDSIWEPTKRNV